MELLLATSVFHPSPGPSTWGTARGELAHVSLGLAKGLRTLGHRTTLVAPLADADAALAESGLGLARRIRPLTFEMNGEKHERRVLDARLPSGVEVVLLTGHAPADATSPDEVAIRCAQFGHAVAALALSRLGTRGEGPDGSSELEAVVALGEAAAFSMLALREDAKAPHREGEVSPKLLAGLARLWLPFAPAHDISVAPALLARLGVSQSLFSTEGIEFYGRVSFAKSGAVAADRVLCLGDGVRETLVIEGAPHRFDGVFRARGEELVSIGAGVDVAQYNPATDPSLPSRFDADDATGKALCKSALISELELDRHAGLPLLTWMASERDAHEGKHVAEALAHAARGDVCIVATLPESARTTPTAHALNKAAHAHPGRLAVRFGVADHGLHRLLGGSDFLLVTDRDGISATPARAALRYGTLPIAFASGGVRDGIVDIDAALATGHGFLFAGLDEPSVFGAIARALSAYAAPRFRHLRHHVMQADAGYERAARRLASLVALIEG